MNKYLSQLVELCEFDKQLDGFKPKIEAAQEKLSKKSTEINGAKEWANGIFPAKDRPQATPVMFAS